MATFTTHDLAPEGEPTWTVEGLARLTGTTVRTIRYYGTLGLLPPPERRGRIAFYDDRHRARLELVRTYQEQGLNLAAIEQRLAQVASDSPARDLDLLRALAQGWAVPPPGALDRADLSSRAGRELTDEDIALLQRIGTLRTVDGGYEASAALDVGLELIDLDIPAGSMEAAGEAMRRHINAMVLELGDILRTQVLIPMRTRHETDADHFARTMIRLRQLTLDALVATFQQATNGLVDGSLPGRNKGDS